MSEIIKDIARVKQVQTSLKEIVISIEPIEDEVSKYKKTYHLYGMEMEHEEWSEIRKEREGLPWYKQAGIETNRL